MTLQEIFDSLATGELIQMSIGGQPAGELNEANQAKVIPHINLALTNLYRRFDLKQGRVRLVPTAGRALYTIGSKFYLANTRSRETDRYLVGEGTVFPDDVLKIERVVTDLGRDLVLNDTNSEYAVHTPTINSVRLPLRVVNQYSDLPDWLKTSFLELIYRAGHPKIALDALLDRDLVQLPVTHLDALLYFVASRIHMPTGMNPQANQGNPYMALYEKACKELEDQGLELSQTSGWDLLRDRGFV